MSSNITPKPFFIFLSIKLIGKGLNISKTLKLIKATEKGTKEGINSGKRCAPSSAPKT